VLNIERMRRRKAWDVMVGLSWAASTDVLPNEDIDAQTESQAEADWLYYWTNRLRGS
jgi:hypothetical protein